MSFLLAPPHAASAAAERQMMIRSPRVMGARHRNSTAAPRRRTKNATPEAAARIAALLAERWPDAHCELDHQNAYQLAVATILSAQSNDRTINTITPAVFAKYPTARALA